MCGLKFCRLADNSVVRAVTFFTDVWIEITAVMIARSNALRSHPSRMCGLKFTLHDDIVDASAVTSFTDVWIEIY